MEYVFPITFFSLLALVIIVNFVVSWQKEKRLYNHGYCSCGGPWKPLGRGLRGIRYWRCQHCGKLLETVRIKPKNNA